MTDIETTGYNDKSNLLQLPHEVLLKIILYLEIPSIAAISQTSKPQNGSLSQIVSMYEESMVWLRFVNIRFNLRKLTSSKPVSCGAPTWKEVFRTLSLRNRIPKFRLPFKQKAIFAIGSSAYFEENAIKEEHEEEKNRNQKKIRKYDYLNCWVMLNHTEDCNVRQLTTDEIRDLGSYPDCLKNIRLRAVGQNPYIELQLAYQNVKSTYDLVLVDVYNASVQMIMKSDSNEDDEELVIRSQKVIQYGSLRPRIIYRSIGDKVYYQDNVSKFRRSSRKSTSSNYHGDEYKTFYNNSHHLKTKSTSVLTSSSLIELEPFEFVVVSVNILLTSFVDITRDFRFETDFLSNAISITTPVRLQSSRDHLVSSQVDSNHIQNHATSHLSNGICFAHFIQEHEVWENYIQLPGNYLSLANVNRFGQL